MKNHDKSHESFEVLLGKNLPDIQEFRLRWKGYDEE